MSNLTEFLDLVCKTYSKEDKSKAQELIIQYIFPIVSGEHMVKDGDNWLTYTTGTLREIIFDKLPKELYLYYRKEYKKLFYVVYDYNKPKFYDDKINLCATPLYKKNKNYKPTADKLNKLKVLEDYMKNILCSGKQECYEFLLKWIANMIQGNKNNSCLYLKGPQGSGKSTLFYFLSRYVIGSNLCLETGSDPIRTKFNDILGGRLLVSIEELENFSKAEWESISSTLKRMITSDEIVLQDKGVKAHKENNINNYILCSNNDAIKDDDGRRYFILDINTAMIGKHDYYTRLYKNIMCPEVGEAFFQFVAKLDVRDFNPQDFPLTQSKMESINKRLDSVARFIKDYYVLDKKDFVGSCKDIYEEYIYTYKGKRMLALDFHKKIAEFGIERKRRGTCLSYSTPFLTLLKMAESRHWMNEFDTFNDYSGQKARTPDEEGPMEHDEDI